MAKKVSGWKTKGMNRDLSVSAFNPEFAFENMNLRLSTNDNNTLMSWVNEKGTAPVMDAGDLSKELILNGCVIGTAIINKYLVLFLTKVWDGNKYYNSIYRLEYNADKSGMIATELYKGNLKFQIDHPLETIVSYESDSIQKVYWTDGINQPRLINIVANNIKPNVDTQFDFVNTLQLKEKVHVKKILGGGGMFAPGVIQYAFTYYHKYGQESNIFYTTPLYYISYPDRGGSPEDKIDNTFRITVEDVDQNFDYLRVYSIQRTSINGTPICKRIQDIEINNLKDAESNPSYTVSYTDTGLSGDLIDPTELLYKGGSGVFVSTMEQKDGTLFMGDITTPDSHLITKEYISVLSGTDESYYRKFKPTIVSQQDYAYASQLTAYDSKTGDSVPCGGFKKDEYYRCGVQFQDERGKWSDPVFIDDVKVLGNASINKDIIKHSSEAGELVPHDTDTPNIPGSVPNPGDKDPTPEPTPTPTPTPDPDPDPPVEGDVQLHMTIHNFSSETYTINYIGFAVINNSTGDDDIASGQLIEEATIAPREDWQGYVIFRNCARFIGWNIYTPSNRNSSAGFANGNTWYAFTNDIIGKFSTKLTVNPTIPRQPVEWIINSRGIAATRGIVETGETKASGSNAEDIVITVPVIKGTINTAKVASLCNSGYKKARAVVVFPTIQDRRVICQGVVNPTLYTSNHRGGNTESDEITRDIYAQASWFFRPKNESDHDKYVTKSTINAPYSKHGMYIGYYNSYSQNGPALAQDSDPKYVKRAEIQGIFDDGNKFRVDWQTLTFHSPDLEFDTDLMNIDYSSDSLKYYRIGSVDIKRTFSDIDIQTETPTISDRGSGFIKKSFTGMGAEGIISGLFWDDFVVDDNASEDTNAFYAYTHQRLSAKWAVYLWNKTGSLNNDITRPADKGVASAVLKKKIISNLRYAGGKDWRAVSAKEFDYYTQLFASDQTEILKLNTFHSESTETIKKWSNVYFGNIDTLLIPDKDDGMYFAYNDSTPANFSDTVNCKTCALLKDAQNNYANWGIWTWVSQIKGWGHHYDEIINEQFGLSNNPFYGSVGDNYRNLVLKKDNVRMKYKSTPHLVLTQKDSDHTYAIKDYIGNTVEDGKLPVFELRRPTEPTDLALLFGGQSSDALKENVWIPCGEPVDLTDDNGNPLSSDVSFEYTYGDTYYQRWDCLKTYAFTPEDINQVVEIGSFMLESRVNIDGRYDRNRGQLSNLYMSPQNFNLINPVYSQMNNFFTYRIQNSDAYEQKYFPNQITWSKIKTSGADVDLWTNVTLASILEMDGDKGKVRKLIRLNDQLLCFQDKGISQVLYNDNVQISSTDGVPIEIANSGKVMGKKYFTDSIGCSNKWSIAQTPSGIYFMDSINKAIFLFNGQLNNLSGSLGMNTWCKNNIPDADTIWTPADYMLDNGTSSGEPVDGFMNFVTYYDKLNQDVLFINKNTALAYSERLGVFTSFYDYGNSPYLCNLNDTGVWAKIAVELDVEDPDTPPHDEYSTSLWKHQAGDYCRFFGIPKPFSMTLVGNPEPQADKIFTNLEFRACVDGEGVLGNDGKFAPTTPFDYLETWNEYQHGYTSLSIKNGHNLFKHGGDSSALIRKFRIWRNDIPRNNCLLDSERIAGTEYSYQTDESLNVSRYIRKPSDRMRNPWLYIKLMKNAASSNNRTEIHDIVMTYFD